MAFFNALALLIVAFASLGADQGQSENAEIVVEKSLLTDKAIFCRTGLYCAAQEAGMGNRALSLINYGRDQVVIGAALAPETATVDGKIGAPHPLYDAHIIMLDSCVEKPLCVTEKNPHQLVLVDSLATTSPEIKTFSPTDSHGNQNARIVGLTTGVTGYCEHSNFVNYIIMAVAPHDGRFGDAGSGFSVIKNTRRAYKETTKGEDGQKRERMEILYKFMDAALDVGTTTFTFNAGHEALALNEGFGSLITEDVAFGWCTDVCRFYIGLQIKTDSSLQHNQGMHALLRGRIHEDKLVLEPLANLPTPLTAMGPNQSAAVYHLRSLYTSTGNPYLIVVGGVGDVHKARSNVLALPLVHKGRVHTNLLSYNADTDNGLLASRMAQPHLHTQKISFQTTRNYARGLRIEDPVFDTDSMPQAHDPEVCVGAGIELPNSISAVEIVNDAVYVAIAEDGNGQKAGIFHSQPIFDSLGKIAGWTPWQRVFGLFEGVVGLQLDAKKSLARIIKAEHDPLTRIAYTAWSAKKAKPATANQLCHVIKNYFPAEAEGILHCADYSYHELGGMPGERTSILLATGLKKIAMVETGHDTEGAFEAYPNDYGESVRLMDNGTIELNHEPLADNQPVVNLVTGGVLDDIGAITHSALVQKDNQVWLVIAGVKGVAVLCDAQGNGWDFRQGIGMHGCHLAGMSFKRLGSMTGIKKIIADRDSLYVMTMQHIMKIGIDAYWVAKNTIGSEIIVEAGDMGGLFDAVIDDHCIMLAATKGLFVTPDYRTQEFSSLALPNMFGHPYAFSTISAQGYNKGFAYGGQVYVMVGSVQKQASAVYRLFVNKDDRIMPIGIVPSYEYEAAPGAFMMFNSYRNCFATNGSSYFSAHPKKTVMSALLKVYGMSEIYSAHVEAPDIFVAPLYLEKFKRISSIVQNSTTGAWYFAGDFGMRMNG